MLGAAGELVSQVVATGRAPVPGRATLAFAAANYAWTAPLYHAWYPLLETLVSPDDRFGVLRRLAFDRLLAAPIHLAVFLPLVNALRGFPGGSAMDVLSAGEPARHLDSGRFGCDKMLASWSTSLLCLTSLFAFFFLRAISSLLRHVLSTDHPWQQH